MRENKLHTPVGFRDILPEERAVRSAVTRRIEKTIEARGYDFIESPMLEYIDVFSQDGKGSSDQGLMYKFFDKEGHVLAMRCDMTPPIARIAATAFDERSLPIRLSYSGSIYKSSGSYQGKLYEIQQAGVELIGSAGVDADAEIVCLAVECILASGIKDFKINLGQVQFFRGILEETGLDKSGIDILQDKIAEKDFVGVETLIEEGGMNTESAELLKELPRLVGKKEVLRRAAELTKNKSALEALDMLSELMDIISARGLDKYVDFDLGMVNQLNYYTGIIFRGYTYGTGYSIVGGGRYDNLVGAFGRELPAVGLGINISEIMSVIIRGNGFKDISSGKTLFAFSKEGRRRAYEIAGKYRAGGRVIEESLIGFGYDENFDYAKNKGYGHMLYFSDCNNVSVVSFKDDMGGYTVEMPVDELVLPESEEEGI